MAPPPAPSAQPLPRSRGRRHARKRRHARRHRGDRGARRPRRHGPDAAGCGRPHGRVRPWIAARALGVTAYLLLALEVALGLVLSHPRNTAEWRKTRQIFPWHEMLTVFTVAFLALHVVLLAIDPFANVGVSARWCPGFSGYRPPAVAIGTVALYALIFTALTAKWTRLLPVGWWLKVHRFAAVTFLLTWVPRGPRRHRRWRPDSPLPGHRPAHPGGRRASLVDREGPPARRVAAVTPISP